MLISGACSLYTDLKEIRKRVSVTREYGCLTNARQWRNIESTYYTAFPYTNNYYVTIEISILLTHLSGLAYIRVHNRKNNIEQSSEIRYLIKFRPLSRAQKKDHASSIYR